MRSLYARLVLFLAFSMTANCQLIPNIAFNKSAMASGIWSNRKASYAVDGNNQTGSNDFCCTAVSSDYTWWRVDLGSVYVVTSITIFASGDGIDGNYIRNCIIIVGTTTDDSSQETCVTLGDPSPIASGRSKTFNCSTWLAGRYVTVKKSSNEALTLCEVIVTGLPLPQLETNVALSKRASQSVQWGQRVASNAVDGNLQTSSNELCATAGPSSDNYTWWQVDLGAEYIITSLTIYISADVNYDGTYMKNCNIYIGDSNSSVTSQPVCVSLGNPSGILPFDGSKTFNCTPWLVGRYITIRKTVQGELITVCELIASGYIIDVTATSTTSITQSTTTSTTTTSTTTTTTTTTTTKSPTTSTTSTTTTTSTARITASTASNVDSTVITAPSSSTASSTSTTVTAVVGASSSDDQKRAGIIAGVIVGFFVLLAIVIIIIIVLIRRGKCQPCCECTKQLKKPPSDIPLVTNIHATSDIPVEQLDDHVKQMKLKGAFEAEYKQLPKGDVCEAKIGALATNKLKNRFKNVLPFDNNMVPITSFDGKNDLYINASFIKGYNNIEKAYIATQGPKADTVDDFWLMIWQYNVNRIVVLTRLIENAKTKCEQYWPAAINESKVCGTIAVYMSVEEEFSDHVYREFRIFTDGDEQNARTVRHFHFLSFDDKTRPSQLYPLVAFRRKIRTFDNVASGPMVVHCSAGVGRTGTFIALDYLLDQARSERMVNIYNCVAQMRYQRTNMVQTEPQYVFLYEALLDGITTGDTAIPCNNFTAVHAEISKSRDGSAISSLEKQYLLLKRLKEAPTDRTSVGLDPVNAVKNRSGNIIAYDESRPRLVTPWKEGNDYINAIFINSFRARDAYVLTQLPLGWTIVDFWRMIYDYQMPVIVLLDGNDSPALQGGGQYWPDEPSVVTQGPFDVELKSDETIQIGTALVAVREFSVRKTNTTESVEVRQYHLLNWSASRSVPQTSAVLLDLMNAVMHWQQLNAVGSQIVMQCTDGAERAGLFASGCYMVDKMKVDQAVDVFISCRFITTQRPKAIDNVDQYRFLHDLALTFMKQFEEYANFGF